MAKLPLKWHIEQRKVSQLIPWDKNPHVMNDAEKQNLSRSIDKFDYVEVVVINTDNRIIGGHQRTKDFVAKGKLGEVIDVRVPNRKLSEKEFMELAIRLNKNRGHDDEDLLKEFFSAEDLKDWGFNDQELNNIFDDLVELEEEDFNLEEELEKIKKPVTKEGDIILLGKHKLLCGDSTNPDNWKTLIENKVAVFHLTDPPYNVDYEGKTEKKLKIENDKMNNEAFLNFLTTYFISAGSALAPGSSSYIFHNDREGLNFRKAFIDSGNKLAQCLIWVKNSLVMSRQDYHWQHESILYGWKEGAGHKWYSNRKQSTVLNFDRPLKNEEHPTMKPVPLVAYLMKNSSAIGDIVIDGFLGSGTTIVTAEELKRICYGMELDPKYCDVIVTRWEKLTGKKVRRIPSNIPINVNTKKASQKSSKEKGS